MQVPGRLDLSRRAMLEWLNKLPQVSPEAGISLYLGPGTAPAMVEARLSELKPADVPAELPELVAGKGEAAGAAIFWGPEHHTLVLPPFPVGVEGLFPGLDATPLRSLYRRELLVGLLLVRLGAYAIGVFRNEERISSKVGTALVHGRHKKGGSSAARFRRHREKQIESEFTRVCAHAREQFEPQLAELDYLIYGGERLTVLGLRQQCDFLKKLDDRTIDRLLNVRFPRQPALESAIHDAWRTTVVEWEER